MIVLMLVTGCFLAPALTVTFVLVGDLAPAGTVTEAFAWLITLFTTGAAVGSAVTGVVLDHAGMGDRGGDGGRGARRRDARAGGRTAVAGGRGGAACRVGVHVGIGVGVRWHGLV